MGEVSTLFCLLSFFDTPFVLFLLIGENEDEPESNDKEAKSADDKEEEVSAAV